MFANGADMTGAHDLLGQLVGTFFGSGMITNGAHGAEPRPCTDPAQAYPTLHVKCAS